MPEGCPGGVLRERMGTSSPHQHRGSQREQQGICRAAGIEVLPPFCGCKKKKKEEKKRNTKADSSQPPGACWPGLNAPRHGARRSSLPLPAQRESPPGWMRPHHISHPLPSPALLPSLPAPPASSSRCSSAPQAAAFPSGGTTLSYKRKQNPAQNPTSAAPAAAAGVPGSPTLQCDSSQGTELFGKAEEPSTARCCAERPHGCTWPGLPPSSWDLGGGAAVRRAMLVAALEQPPEVFPCDLKGRGEKQNKRNQKSPERGFVWLAAAGGSRGKAAQGAGPGRDSRGLPRGLPGPDPVAPGRGSGEGLGGYGTRRGNGSGAGGREHSLSPFGNPCGFLCGFSSCSYGSAAEEERESAQEAAHRSSLLHARPVPSCPPRDVAAPPPTSPGPRHRGGLSSVRCGAAGVHMGAHGCM